MFAWFESLPVLEQIFLYIALPSTLILVIQMFTLMIGGSGDAYAGGDSSADADGFDSDASGDDIGLADDYGLRFVTMRGIITFLTIAGWSGVFGLELGLSPVLASFIAFACGSLSLIGVAYLIRSLLRLQVISNIDYRAALGQTCDVYLTIPANAVGTGKVTLTLNGALAQYDAITNGSQTIKTGDLVRVTDIVRDNVMVVERDT